MPKPFETKAYSSIEKIKHIDKLVSNTLILKCTLTQFNGKTL